MNGDELNKALDLYCEVRKSIHDAFGYNEDWRVIPLDDQRSRHWMLTGDREAKGKVVYSDSPLTSESIEAGREIYSGNIYTQRFLPKWVYRTETHTLVCVDTQTDGNKFLMVFDNSKEVVDKALTQLYEEHWG